jgi:hypothetical protein
VAPRRSRVEEKEEAGGGEEEVEDWGTPPRAEASGERERERERGTGEETGQRTLWVGVI